MAKKKTGMITDEVRELTNEVARATASMAYIDGMGGEVNYFRAMESLLYNYKKMAALVADYEAYTHVELQGKSASIKSFSPSSGNAYRTQDDILEEMERDKVKAALQRRGFSYEVIRQAVSRTLETLPEGGETPEPEETPETGDGQEELLALIRKKYAKNMADRAGMEKTIAALYRRGYPLEAIKAAMNTILEQEENCRDD